MRTTITESVVDSSVVLHLTGEFDIAMRDALLAATDRVAARDADHQVHVDLTGVTFIDCGCLRIVAALVLARHRLGDPSTVVVVQPTLRRLLEVTGYAPLLPVVSRLVDAA
jgi:anti-anti-sigma factor